MGIRTDFKHLESTGIWTGYTTWPHSFWAQLCEKLRTEAEATASHSHLELDSAWNAGCVANTTPKQPSFKRKLSWKNDNVRVLLRNIMEYLCHTTYQVTGCCTSQSATYCGQSLSAILPRMFGKLLILKVPGSQFGFKILLFAQVTKGK